MRILNLLFSFTVGGTERLVTDVCNSLVKQDNDVHLFIVNDLVDDAMINRLDSNVHIVQYARPVGGGKIKVLLDLARYIKKWKIDVIHCNALNTPELLLVVKLVNPTVKIIYTIHGMNQYCQLGKIKIIYRNLICDRFIAISESVKADIIKAGANADKTIVVYNAIDFDRIETKNVARRTFDKKNVVIGNIARFQPAVKGQDILYEAMGILIKKYPTIKCYFAGASDQEHMQEYVIIRKKAKKEYPNNIFFVGNINDVALFLSKVDLFVLPSRSEGFGLSLVEAMSMGVPCIASKLAGPEEVMEYGKRGRLFKSGNIEELAAVIDFVIQNYAQEKKIAEENSQYVKNKYNIERMTEQLLEIYQEA
ncbi:glycosyltransferase family 4 protein [Anaerobutyricum hallii]|uniref:glycosyltransferase family 4 protein n=1 Tax=Anaerobutyricum hallii TaxID=39488 RepID=UPI0026728C41|nr:glycosyltransferase family 4 protein [Anaerobutyricum hallii]